MEDYFQSYLETASDSVFTEKYWDIYFRNHCFIQTWLPNENTLIELSDAYDLDTGSDCDHCCSCHGHFTHIAFYFDIESSFLKKSPNLVSVYSEATPNRFINQIERPPRI